MRLSGVLPEDDDGSTDLATLERRLADKAAQSQRDGSSATPAAHPTTEEHVNNSPSQMAQARKVDDTPVQPGLPSPTSGTASPEPPKPTTENKEDDTLAEMMCSLVTNNYGETRYIGTSTV